MTTKKSREDYSNAYEWRREQLASTIWERDDEKGSYPNIINFFVPKGHTPVTGKVFTPPSPEFKYEYNLKECFTKIQEKMVTKALQPRKTMLNLKDYEVTAWSSLLEYLRFSWQDGESSVWLTGAEYWMLFGEDKKKASNKAKKK